MSRQQPTIFSAGKSLYRQQPSVGHHIVVPPGSRPRRYSRTVSFRLLRVHISNCASLHQTNRSALAVVRTDTSFCRISQHHYSGSFCSGDNGILQHLMSKAGIRGNLTEFAPDIAAVKQAGLTYVLGETNSFSCHGAPGVSNVAGAALWGLDYALFAGQLGVNRLYFHQGVGYKYNFVRRVFSQARHHSAHVIIDSANNTDEFHSGRFEAYAATCTSHTTALLCRYHCSRTHRVFRLHQDRRVDGRQHTDIRLRSF